MHCSLSHLNSFLQSWWKKAGRRWQLVPAVLPSSCLKTLPASQSQKESPRQGLLFPAHLYFACACTATIKMIKTEISGKFGKCFTCATEILLLQQTHSNPHFLFVQEALEVRHHQHWACQCDARMEGRWRCLMYPGRRTVHEHSLTKFLAAFSGSFKNQKNPKQINK